MASSAVDVATTSQSEADQKRGREIRQREERLGKLQRDYDKQIDRCQASHLLRGMADRLLECDWPPGPEFSFRRERLETLGR